MKKPGEFRKQQAKIAQESWEKMMQLGYNSKVQAEKMIRIMAELGQKEQNENVSNLPTIGVS